MVTSTKHYKITDHQKNIKRSRQRNNAYLHITKLMQLSFKRLLILPSWPLMLTLLCVWHPYLRWQRSFWWIDSHILKRPNLRSVSKCQNGIYKYIYVYICIYTSDGMGSLNHLLTRAPLRAMLIIIYPKRKKTLNYLHNTPPGAKLGLCRSIIFSKLIQKF